MSAQPVGRYVSTQRAPRLCCVGIVTVPFASTVFNVMQTHPETISVVGCQQRQLAVSMWDDGWQLRAATSRVYVCVGGETVGGREGEMLPSGNQAHPRIAQCPLSFQSYSSIQYFWQYFQ